MKTLLNGCAAVALLVGLAGTAHAAALEVQDAPIHAVPTEAGDAPPLEPAVQTPPAAVTAPAAQVARAEPAEAPKMQRVSNNEPDKVEPAAVRALMEQKAAPAPALTPEENAFFAVLGKRVTDAASAYETYVRRATAIDAHFSDAATVQKAVKSGAAYHPQQLQEGIVAYAALLALRSDTFVDGVKSIRDPAFADRLLASPQSVLEVRGSDMAAADVAGALRAQGAALLAAGKTITQAAYDVQAEGWSKSPVADPRTVLAETKDAAAQPRSAGVSAKDHLLQSLIAPAGAAGPLPVSAASAAGAPDVVRGLALAALAIMGRTGDSNEASFEALLHDATSADCLKMAKLNLNQCLAVAGPQYEDVYCAGRHGVSETAQCVSGAANGAGPALPPSLAAQRAEGYGPEQARAYGQQGLIPQTAEDDDSIPTPAAQYYPAAPRAPNPAYAPPPAREAYAQNDRAYAPYQEAPAGYARQQPPPQAQYQQQPYPQQGYAQPQQQAYRQQPYPAQGGYQPTQPTAQYPYGYAARGYYGQ
jgi:hypothetical protein